MKLNKWIVSILAAVVIPLACHAGNNVMEPVYATTDKGTFAWTNSVGGPAMLMNVICTPMATTECTQTVHVISRSGAITNMMFTHLSVAGSNSPLTQLEYIITDGDVIKVTNGPTNTYVQIKIDIRDRRDSR